MKRATTIPPGTRERIRKNLLGWFRTNSRAMPWRSTRDPYRIWVAEVLLQQTRVRAALPSYERFLRRFPPVRALAAASPSEVLRAWSGLGYYARARNLHAAAREIVSRHGGRIPEDRAALLRLPGIGPYTAAALLSFIHSRREGVVDGNIARVLARLFLVPGDPRSGPVLERLRGIAGDLVPPRRARDFNLAMMDLGSTVCRPRSPRCPECPLAGVCRACRRGLQGRYPQTAPRARPVRIERLVGVLEDGDRLLLVPRPQRGLLAGMWELPGCDGGPDGAGRLSRRLSESWGVRVRPAGEVAVAEHSITNRRIRIRAFRAGVPRRARIPEGRWVRRRDLSRYPITTATRKILERLREAGGAMRGGPG
ncbi:MAG: A/G-specific adenine glycosylase [Acidobacteria bacterium]|nr:A/G-specific adenine glycosylase [Acidobacteriota bacterium]